MDPENSDPQFLAEELWDDFNIYTISEDFNWEENESSREEEFSKN